MSAVNYSITLDTLVYHPTPTISGVEDKDLICYNVWKQVFGNAYVMESERAEAYVPEFDVPRRTNPPPRVCARYCPLRNLPPSLFRMLWAVPCGRAQLPSPSWQGAAFAARALRARAAHCEQGLRSRDQLVHRLRKIRGGFWGRILSPSCASRARTPHVKNSPGCVPCTPRPEPPIRA
uniref:Phycobilisome 27.9kD linker polypeptide n=1 Tax=Griffithsia japonica TaxID=83288 RepID=Q7XY89_GRIJA|nr:phycobilisome 27.9kD linker polypeptide [Griffithsia japonica]